MVLLWWMMMNVHSNIQPINTIGEAVQTFTHHTQCVGVLSELNVDIFDKGNENIIVKYKGVVDINNAFIKIYGNVSNSSSKFNSMMEKLKSLEAEIKTLSNDGEIIRTEYKSKASVVAIYGMITSPDSIYVDSINEVSSKVSPYFQGIITGYVLDVNQQNRMAKLFVIDSYYHRTINIVFGANTSFNDVEQGDMLKTYIDVFGYQDQYPPLQCTYYNKLDTKINDDVIQQALKEHQIFMNALTY